MEAWGNTEKFPVRQLFSVGSVAIMESLNKSRFVIPAQAGQKRLAR
jgi:hypothetical protein